MLFCVCPPTHTFLVHFLCHSNLFDHTWARHFLPSLVYQQGENNVGGQGCCMNVPFLIRKTWRLTGGSWFLLQTVPQNMYIIHCEIFRFCTQFEEIISSLLFANTIASHHLNTLSPSLPVPKVRFFWSPSIPKLGIFAVYSIFIASQPGSSKDE